LTLSSNGSGKFDAAGFVECTEGLHKDIIHILLSGHEPTVTIPAIHGVEATAEIIGNFLRSAVDHASCHSPRILDRAQWPEYVVWPNHMLAFFDSQMRERVLDLE